MQNHSIIKDEQQKRTLSSSSLAALATTTTTTTTTTTSLGEATSNNSSSIENSTNTNNSNNNGREEEEEMEGETITVYPSNDKPQDDPCYVKCTSTGDFIPPPPPRRTCTKITTRTTRSITRTSSKEQQHQTTAEDINKTLNLDLGLSSILDPNKHRLFIWLNEFITKLLICWWEDIIIFRMINSIPARIRRCVCLLLWKYIYYPIHSHLLGRTTSIHYQASKQYHAIYSIMYWGRYFPVTIHRMRFALRQLDIAFPIMPKTIHIINTRNNNNNNTSGWFSSWSSRRSNKITTSTRRTSTTSTKKTMRSTMRSTTTSHKDSSSNNSSKQKTDNDEIPSSSSSSSSPPPPSSCIVRQIDELVPLPAAHEVPECQRNHCHAKGLFLYTNHDDDDDDDETPTLTEYTMFWIYGGAFLSGDTIGNLPAAYHIAKQCIQQQPTSTTSSSSSSRGDDDDHEDHDDDNNVDHKKNKKKKMMETITKYGMDVYLAEHRLVPDHGTSMNDILWDICINYHWLCQYKLSKNHDPTKIILLGISSGAGIVIRLLQSIAELYHQKQTLPTYLNIALTMSSSSTSSTQQQQQKQQEEPQQQPQQNEEKADSCAGGDNSTTAGGCATTTRSSNNNNYVVPMPTNGGAILIGPFVDYSIPEPTSSFVQYPKHDIIVNQRVYEYTKYFDTHMNGQRYEHSPVNRTFYNDNHDDTTTTNRTNSTRFPPICVIVSEHEIVYDQTVQLINNARKANIAVTVGMWRYMCHVFTMLAQYIPEGEQSIQFIISWINEQIMK